MDNILSLAEIKANIDAVKIAYLRALSSGGVESYTINTGQGSTTVKQSTPDKLRKELQELIYMYNEIKEHQDASHVSIVRDFNACRYY